MHALGIAPVVRFSAEKAASSTPLQSASIACFFTIVSSPLMIVVASSALTGAGTVVTYARFDVVAVTEVVLI